MRGGMGRNEPTAPGIVRRASPPLPVMRGHDPTASDASCTGHGTARSIHDRGRPVRFMLVQLVRSYNIVKIKMPPLSLGMAMLLGCPFVLLSR